MVDFDINLNDRGYGSFPRELRNTWGRRLKIIPNYSAGIVFRKGTSMADVEKSLRILLQDIENRREKEELKKQQKNNIKKEGTSV